MRIIHLKAGARRSVCHRQAWIYGTVRTRRTRTMIIPNGFCDFQSRLTFSVQENNDLIAIYVHSKSIKKIYYEYVKARLHRTVLFKFTL